MSPKLTPLRLTSNTRAALTATTAGTLPTAGRFGYLIDDNKAILIGTGVNTSPLEYPEKSAIAAMISNAISNAISGGGGGGGTAGNLITAPTISGTTSAQAGQSVTLTASGSAYLWGGSAGITYRWTKNAVTTDGSTLSVAAGETASVIALDANGNKSPTASQTITVSTNAPPSTPTIVTAIPATVTRGSTYPVAFAANDPEGGTVTFAITNVVGCTATSTSVTIDAAATSISFDVRAVDAQGLQSVAALAVSRSSGNVVSPTGDITVPAGTTRTIVIPAGTAGTVTLDGNGGAGKLATAGSYWSDNNFTGTPSSETFKPDPLVYKIDSGYTAWGPLIDIPPLPVSWTYASTGETLLFDRLVLTRAETDGTDYYGQYQTAFYKAPAGVIMWQPYCLVAGSTTPATTGTSSTVTGGITKSWAGSASGVTTSPASTQSVHSVSTTTPTTITVTAAANGGSVRVRF
jgi:hypothetical protein